MNEANLLSELAYEKGIYPPGRCSPPFGNCSAGNSDIEPLIAMHNMLLAHSKAVKLYREQFQASEVILCTTVLYSFFFSSLITKIN